MSLCVFTQPFKRKLWGRRLRWSCCSPERVQGTSSIKVSFEVIHLVISYTMYKMVPFRFRAVHKWHIMSLMYVPQG